MIIDSIIDFMIQNSNLINVTSILVASTIPIIIIFQLIKKQKYMYYRKMNKLYDENYSFNNENFLINGENFLISDGSMFSNNRNDYNSFIGNFESFDSKINRFQDQLQKQTELIQNQSIMFEKFRNHRIEINPTITIPSKTDQTVSYDKIKYIASVSSDIAHTLKTPLSGIKCTLRLLKKEIGNQGEVRINELDVAIKTLDEAIEGYSNLGIETIDSPKESVELRDVIESFFRIMALSTDKKVNFDFSIPDNIIISHKLFSHLVIPLINILENAFVAITDNGIIKILVTETNSKLKINIFNNGPPISEPDDKIYERGYSTKDSNGIGLTIGKEIVEDFLKGKMYHHNEPSGGVTFTIEIEGENDDKK